MTPHQYQALVRLQPRLRHAIVARFGPYHADDLVQEANVGIIKRASADPTYLVQQPAYLVRAGLWRAGDALRQELAHQSHTAPLEAAIGQLESAPDPLETIAVREAIAKLSTKQRAIANGLAAGQRRKEIAAALGIKPQSLTWHYSALRKKLSEVA